jgi:hypothetical protein
MTLRESRRPTAEETSKVLRNLFACFSAVAMFTACNQDGGPTAASVANFSGLYRPAGLEVQPCGRNEWMRRSFETDTFCNGDNSGFPFKPEGLERWKTYNVIDDPVLGCVEDFPRNAMRGRPMRITLGEDTTEIAYWFNNEWFVRTVHGGGPPPTRRTPSRLLTGRWATADRRDHAHARRPMFNDHNRTAARPVSRSAFGARRTAKICSWTSRSTIRRSIPRRSC